MGGIEKNVSIFLDEVGVDSEEHKKYLEKLNKVLDEMKNSSNGAERKHYISFKGTIDNFDRYLSEKKINLTSHEKDRFAIIAVANLSNLAKKRMAEDLIHQVKNRVAADLESKAEDEKRKDDIARLSKSGFWFTDWYRLTSFGLEFGTVTLFTHRYRSESFDVIRRKGLVAHKEIVNELKVILDKYYYYLSVLEYNSILRLYNLGKFIDRLSFLKRNPSYYPMEILEEMNSFSAAYIVVMRNVKSIDKGLNKVFKDHQPGHGFMGNVWFLTGRHIFNSRAVKQSEYDLITGTIPGSLYSYYTTYLGVRVRNFNQLMHIVSEDGTLNSSEKEYTPEAMIAIESESNDQITESSKVKSKLFGMENITTKYSEMGRTLAKRLFEIDSRGSLAAWNKDSQIKPFFRLMKIFEAYSKFILELIITRENFELEYDNNIIKGYFDSTPELVKAVDEYRSFSIELQGTRGKNIQNYKVSDAFDRDEYIKKIMEIENISILPGEEKQLRETLNEISSRCYNLCMRFNDLLNKFHKTGKFETREVSGNYNFLFNAKIIHPKVRNLEFLLNKKEVYLNDLLEAGCSVAEYFAEILQNSGIISINEEVIKLQKELEKFNISPESGIAGITSAEDQSDENDLDSEVDKIYIDTLTGFKKWEYFEDFILPEIYDDKGNYSGDKSRQVFCAEISNLVEINRVCGNDSGDKVFKKFSEILNKIFRPAGSENVLLRGKEGLVIGYVSGNSPMESVDLLLKVLSMIREFSLESGIEFLPDIVFNAGIYSEKKGTNAARNLDIARNIMFQSSDGKEGHVGFIKNPEQIIGDKDFDMRGRLREGLISVLS